MELELALVYLGWARIVVSWLPLPGALQLRVLPLQVPFVSRALQEEGGNPSKLWDLRTKEQRELQGSSENLGMLAEYWNDQSGSWNVRDGQELQVGE